MKAIETIYNGYRFRSRLEARWAVFFDELGIKYQYELEGFKLSDGTLYLPDFYLPDLKFWVEVKGIMTETDEKKLDLFSNDLKSDEALWIVGDIPDEDYFKNRFFEDDVFFTVLFNFGFDHPYWPCVCPICGKPGIEFEGRGSRICNHDSDDKGYSYDDERVLNAYRVAKMARFEHGETPDKYKQNFFRIPDSHGNEIVIYRKGDDFAIWHHQYGTTFASKKAVSILAYSLCSARDFSDFQKWLKVKGR